MDYISISFHTSDEVIQAWITQLPFDSFEEKDSIIIGYIPETRYAEMEESVVSFTKSHDIVIKKYVVKGQNWNEIWESNFDPITVGDFCHIRADFHPKDSSATHEIVINPKMAFGTGHHETTFMMIAQMRSIDFKGKHVLDFGCGTGILAILAEKMDADHILGIEIEEDAVVNTMENMVINNSKRIEIRAGDLSMTYDEKFDIILANINRNVLLSCASELVNTLNEKGILLLSGILNQDGERIVQAYEKLGLKLERKDDKGEWLCLKFNTL